MKKLRNPEALEKGLPDNKPNQEEFQKDLGKRSRYSEEGRLN